MGGARKKVERAEEQPNLQEKKNGGDQSNIWNGRLGPLIW